VNRTLQKQCNDMKNSVDKLQAERVEYLENTSTFEEKVNQIIFAVNKKIK
jgi:hypothetical protein